MEAVYGIRPVGHDHLMFDADRGILRLDLPQFIPQDVRLCQSLISFRASVPIVTPRIRGR
jgi:hypothetical protein